MKIGIIGGDRREKILSKMLVNKGYRVKILSDIAFSSNSQLEFYKDYQNVIKDVDVVYGTLPGINNEGKLKKTFISDELFLDEKFFSIMNKNTLFLIGSINSEIQKILSIKNINYVELNSLPEMAIHNAIPTAEGAIKIAIEKTPFTLFQNNVLITGLGKVGFRLGWRLKALGANVFAVTRSEEAIARGKDLGLNMISYNDLSKILPKIRLIYNTVPVKIITKKYLKYISKESLIIDLASSPGGVDFDTAYRLGIETITAPGLPGKVAPESAGKIIFDILESQIKKYFKI